MTDNTTKTIEDLLKDPKYANLTENDEIPDEILEQLSGAQLSAIFVEQMIADKGVEATDELRAKLGHEMAVKVSTEIVANLPDYIVDKLDEERVDGRISEEALDRAAEEAGLDIDTITENAMLEFRNDYLEGEEE